jgi:hypothetical protein
MSHGYKKIVFSACGVIRVGRLVGCIQWEAHLGWLLDNTVTSRHTLQKPPNAGGLPENWESFFENEECLTANLAFSLDDDAP